MRLTRRKFITSLAAGGASLSLGQYALANPPGDRELRGKQFALDLDYLPVNFSGNQRHATCINGQLPGPVLRWKEGDEVSLRVTNHLRETSSIHWHGIILPTEMDGVPGRSFSGIKPGESFDYRFRLNQHGTYW